MPSVARRIAIPRLERGSPKLSPGRPAVNHWNGEFDGLAPQEWANRNWRRYVYQPAAMPAMTIEQALDSDMQGIYFLWLDGGLRYIGLASNLARRLYQHRRDGRIAFDRVTTVEVNGRHVSDFMLRSIECAYIRALLPPDNRDCGAWGHWHDAPRMSKVIRRLWLPFRRDRQDQG